MAPGKAKLGAAPRRRQAGLGDHDRHVGKVRVDELEVGGERVLRRLHLRDQAGVRRELVRVARPRQVEDLGVVRVRGEVDKVAGVPRRRGLHVQRVDRLPVLGRVRALRLERRHDRVGRDPVDKGHRVLRVAVEHVRLGRLVEEVREPALKGRRVRRRGKVGAHERRQPGVRAVRDVDVVLPPLSRGRTWRCPPCTCPRRRRCTEKAPETERGGAG